MRADQDRGIFHAAIEKSAVGVLVRLWSRRRRSSKRQVAQCAEATRRLRLGGNGHAPAALQRGLAQSHASIAGDDPQLVPTPLQHWRSDLNSGTAQLQARTLGSDRERRSTLDRQHGLEAFVEQPGLDANDDRAEIGQV